MSAMSAVGAMVALLGNELGAEVWSSQGRVSREDAIRGICVSSGHPNPTDAEVDRLKKTLDESKKKGAERAESKIEASVAQAMRKLDQTPADHPLVDETLKSIAQIQAQLAEPGLNDAERKKLTGLLGMYTQQADCALAIARVEGERQAQRTGIEKGMKRAINLLNVCANEGCGKSPLLDEAVKLQECSKCHLVKYCNKECQFADWKPRHKAVCKPRDS